MVTARAIASIFPRPRPYYIANALASCAAFLALCGNNSIDANAQVSPGVRKPLSVTAAFDTARFATGPVVRSIGRDGTTRLAGDPVFLSPDRDRFAVMLIRGDSARNGNWAEIYVGCRQPPCLGTKPKLVAKLFTHSLAGQYSDGAVLLTYQGLNPLRWTDDRHVALLWSDQQGIRQVVSVDVESGKINELTKHQTDVMSFSVGPNGSVIFSAANPPPDRTLPRNGFVVGSENAIGLLSGLIGQDIADVLGGSRWFVRTSGGQELPVSLPPNRIQTSVAAISPDGSKAIVDAAPRDIPREWERYSDAFFSKAVQEAQTLGPDAFMARQIRQLFVVDMRSGAARPLWSVPASMYVGSDSVRWAPTSRSVLLSPTFAPNSDDKAGMAGRGLYEVNVDTGSYLSVPMPAALAQDADSGYSEIDWITPDRVAVRAGETWLTFVRSAHEWSRARESNEATDTSPVIEVEESINEPPRLYLVQDAGGRQLLLDPNPGLADRYQLGHVRVFKWADDTGRAWTGHLYLPPGYKDGTRYPLVIQTHGKAPDDSFSLSGLGGGFYPALGPGISIYVAQVLANRGIVVLQIEDKNDPKVIMTPAEAPMYLAGYTSSIDRLAKDGIIDPTHVGISGFSRSGWQVEYALTHAPDRFAAALVSDNYDGGYVQALLAWNEGMANDKGAAPFGEGLNVWTREAPAFQADKVQAPLRLVQESGPLALVLSHWEMFARLRQLKKPVELYVAPDIEHGNHRLQNPSQLIPVQEGAVDWFDFWLNCHEDPANSKVDQYTRWRSLRALAPNSQCQAR